MEVIVKIQGSFGLAMPENHPEGGVRVELPPKATLKDLLNHLNIVDSQKIIATMDYRILRIEDPLPEGAKLRIFQLLSGG